MKALLVFSFIADKDSRRFYDVPVVVRCNKKDVDGLIDSFSSYLESNASDNSSYKEMVCDVMDASGLKWEIVHGAIPACDFLCSVHI